MDAIRINPKETPLVIFSEGFFGEPESKTATGVLRYGEWPFVGVIDSLRAGETVRSVTGIPCDAPVFATLEEALSNGTRPKAMMLGIAPKGGKLPPEWRRVLFQAVEAGLHIVNGLHDFLQHDHELVATAEKKNVFLWDVRDPELNPLVAAHPIARQLPRDENVKVVTMVGSDCSVGKMHVALEMHRVVDNAAFLATGQTGIMITGNGIPLDRVIGDFMAGSVEVSILDIIEREHPKYIFVEGQGSLLHPAYSGVTLSLLHGSCPDAMILCHKPDLDTIRGEYAVPIPPLAELVRIYEEAARWVMPANHAAPRVLGVALNTSMLSEDEARAVVKKAEKDTGLPATDPVRYGVANLVKTLKNIEKKTL